MGLAQSISLQDVLHRCAVPLGDLEYRLASLYPVMNYLHTRLLLARRRLHLGHGNQRFAGSITW